MLLVLTRHVKLYVKYMPNIISKVLCLCFFLFSAVEISQRIWYFEEAGLNDVALSQEESPVPSLHGNRC